MNLDALPYIAEVGAALAGFATLVGVIRREQLHSELIFGVVETSLIAVAFALIPSVAVGTASGSAALRVVAFLYVLVWSAAWVRAMLTTRRFIRERTVGATPTFVAVFTLNASGTALALVVACGVQPGRADLLYQLAILCPLLTSILLLWGLMRLLLLPGGPPAA